MSSSSSSSDVTGVFRAAARLAASSSKRCRRACSYAAASEAHGPQRVCATLKVGTATTPVAGDGSFRRINSSRSDPRVGT